MFKIQEVNDSELAFGGRNVLSMMPKYDDIPEEFKGFRAGKFGDFFTDMFFKGIKNYKLYPKEGVDPERHGDISLPLLSHGHRLMSIRPLPLSIL